MVIKGYLFSIIYGLLCILIAGIVHKFGLKTVYTRKITHILVGFEWVILYHYFGTRFHFVIVCLIFSVVLSFSYINKLFPQISSDEDNSPGTVYYCIAMTIMSFITFIYPNMAVPFGIGVFCTSLGDGFAGLFGQIKKHNKQIYGRKTAFGFIACFAFSFLSIFLIAKLYNFYLEIYQIAIIAFFATELELFSKNGLDNISVTLGAAFLSFSFAEFPTFILSYIIPILSTIPIIAFVEKKNALTKMGIAFAIILDVLASVSFGNSGFLILILFFGGSIVIDKLKKQRDHREIENRNAKQVLANGVIGALAALLNIFFPNKVWYIAFSSAFAEAFSDTSASGIGSLSGKTYDPFRRRAVEKGISGGMSLVGTVASFACSTLMASLAWILFDIGIIDFAIIAVSGFMGNLFDSFLGSVLQVKYNCTICGKITEKKEHCSTATVNYSGVSWIDNNTVNLFSTIFSTLLSILLFFIFS